jgi:hypothetical protein
MRQNFLKFDKIFNQIDQNDNTKINEHISDRSNLSMT